MFEQPDEFARDAVGDRRGARVHERERGFVGHKALADPPFHRARSPIEPDHHIVARTDHHETIW
jgi:hypothetical protein